MPDADLVYCLSPAHTDALFDAALLVGGATISSTPGRFVVDGHGHDVDIAGWRTDDPTGFSRACKAIAATALPPSATASSPSPSFISSYGSLVGVLVGAFVTYLFSIRREQSVRRHEASNQMRDAAEAYKHAVTKYINAWSSPHRTSLPSVDDLVERRAELDAQLGRVTSRHGDWRLPQQLRQSLSDHVDNLKPDRLARERDLAPLADELREELRIFTGDVEEVAVCIRQAFPDKKAMSRAATPAPPPATALVGGP